MVQGGAKVQIGIRPVRLHDCSKYLVRVMSHSKASSDWPAGPPLVQWLVTCPPLAPGRISAGVQSLTQDTSVQDRPTGPIRRQRKHGILWPKPEKDLTRSELVIVCILVE